MAPDNLVKQANEKRRAGGDRRRESAKHPLKSKTLWVSGAMAALGTVETMAPGIIPPGPTMLAFSAAMAFLRVITNQPIR